MSALIEQEDGMPLTVWRGEGSGVHVERFDLSKTRHGIGFFFAEERELAASYAARGTEPRAFHLSATNILDLTDPYSSSIRSSPAAQAVLAELRASFDEWVCRHSGEPRDLADWLEAGNLYDYEGTGSGERWNTLFRLASAHGFDAVVAKDVTDGLAATIWVVFDPGQIHPAAPSPVSRPRLG